MITSDRTSVCIFCIETSETSDLIQLLLDCTVSIINPYYYHLLYYHHCSFLYLWKGLFFPIQTHLCSAYVFSAHPIFLPKSLSNQLQTMAHPSYRLLKEIENSSVIRPTDLEWGWDPLEATTDVTIANDSFNIVVHPNTSQGTGAVRGDMPFVPGQIYYWEIEVDGSHTATDMIIGVGTNDFDLKSSEDKYCSLIGSDKKSWGYSYMGVKHHNGERSAYGLRFDKKKTLIGVRLDMWRGTLEFFHNRNPLGIAFGKLNKEHLLYPMVCSTACRTQFTVKYCRSLPVNLQILCLQVLDSNNDSLIPSGLLKSVMDSWWIPKSFSS